jgi:RimJ/RimL family protein N-acetyltransferase
MPTGYTESFAGKSGDKFVIRTLLPGDATEFCSFLDNVSRETFFTNEYPEQPKEPEKIAAGLKALGGNPKRLWLGAFAGKVMAGFLGFKPIVGDSHPYFRHIYTFDLMILKRYWGEGLGGRFVKIVDEFSHKIGAKRIEVLVKDENDRAIELYEKNGYQVEGTRRKSVSLEGRFVDEYYMAKLFM